MRKLPYLTVVLLSLTGGHLLAGPEAIQSSSKEMKETVQQAAEPWNWTGFYVGGRAGYGWNAGYDTDDPLSSPSFFNQMAYQRYVDASGFVGGGEVGYNWQFNRRFVLGAETDFSGSDMDGRSNLNGLRSPSGALAPTSYLRMAKDVDWFGTARARLGFLVCPRFLAYGTGGLAYAHSNTSADVSFTPGVQAHFGSRNGTDVGWTAGGGFEFALAHHWSIKTEYLYVDCGDKRTAAVETINGVPAPPFGESYNWHIQFHTVTAGLNFKF
jgi:outer membrane immunogenic protein